MSDIFDSMDFYLPDPGFDPGVFDDTDIYFPDPSLDPALLGPEPSLFDPWSTPSSFDLVPLGYWTEADPFGQDMIVTGLDPYWQSANLDWCQGDAVPGFDSTCGLTSVANVANMFGVDLTEGEVVDFAYSNGLCSLGGGTFETDQAALLNAAGIPAHWDVGGMTDLAQYVEEGRGVIAEVNAGVLWDDPSCFDGGMANHAITVTGVARDATGAVDGFFVCDSGRQSPEDVRRFVPADMMQLCWEYAGGNCVVTDAPRSQGYLPTYV